MRRIVMVSAVSRPRSFLLTGRLSTPARSTGSGYLQRFGALPERRESNDPAPAVAGEFSTAICGAWANLMLFVERQVRLTLAFAKGREG